MTGDACVQASAAAETCFGDTVALTFTAVADHRAAVASTGVPVWAVSIGLRATTHGACCAKGRLTDCWTESLAGFVSNLNGWLGETFKNLVVRGGMLVFMCQSQGLFVFTFTLLAWLIAIVCTFLSFSLSLYALQMARLCSTTRQRRCCPRRCCTPTPPRRWLSTKSCRRRSRCPRSPPCNV